MFATSNKISALEQLKAGSVWKSKAGNKYARVTKDAPAEDYAEVSVQERTGTPGRFASKTVVYTAKRFVKIFKFASAT